MRFFVLKAEGKEELTANDILHPTRNEWLKLPNNKIKQQGYSFVERMIPLGLSIIILLAWLVIAINQFR